MRTTTLFLIRDRTSGNLRLYRDYVNLARKVRIISLSFLWLLFCFCCARNWKRNGQCVESRVQRPKGQSYISQMRTLLHNRTEARLTVANQSHVQKLLQGVSVWNQWRAAHPETRPDLSGAYLTGVDLTKADLIKADLRGADLTQASLHAADLTEADLEEADLTRATLIKVNLTEAEVNEADLSGANLTKANLTNAALRGAKLVKADLTEATCIGADLAGADTTGADTTGAIFEHP